MAKKDYLMRSALGGSLSGRIPGLDMGNSQNALGAGPDNGGRRGGWVAARELKPGDQVRLADGSKAFVTAVRKTERVEPVYNFTVDGFHTYHVGELGVWVHNTNCGEFFENLDPHKLAMELAQAERLGVSPLTVNGIDDAVRALARSGDPVKWVITEAGDLRMMTRYAGGEEISHAVLSGGQRVRGAGEAQLFLGANGRVFVNDVTAHSGHYMRNSTESMSRTVVERGITAFTNVGFGVF